MALIYSVSAGDSIQAAIDLAVAQGATVSNPALVLVGPGVYGTPVEPPRIRLSPGVHVAAANQGQSAVDGLVVVRVPMYLDDPGTAGSPVVVSGMSVSPSGILPPPQVSPVWLRRGDLLLQNAIVGVSGSSLDSVQVGDASFASSPGPLSLAVIDSSLSGGLTTFGWSTVSVDPTVIGGTLTFQAPSLAGSNTFTCDRTTAASTAFTGAFVAEFRNCKITGTASFDASAYSTTVTPSRLTLVGPSSQTAFNVLLDSVEATSRTAPLSCTAGINFEANDSILHAVANFAQDPPNIPQRLFVVLRRTDFRSAIGSQLSVSYATYSHLEGSLPATASFSRCLAVQLDSVYGGNLSTSFVSTDLIEIRKSRFGQLLLTNPDATTSSAFLTEVQVLGNSPYPFSVAGVSVTAGLCDLKSATVVQSPGSYRNCVFGNSLVPLTQPGLVLSGCEVEFDNCRVFNLYVDGSDTTAPSIARLNQCQVSDNGSAVHAGAPIRVGTTGSGLGTRIWLSGNTLVPSPSAGGFWLEDSTASPASDTVYGAGLSSGSFPPAGTVGNVLAQIAVPLNPANVLVVPFYFA
jgi:hypothetical protein